MDFRITTPERGLPVYGDKTLKQATKRIYECGEKVAANMFEIAAIIAQVDSEKAYKKDGFHSVHEWTQSAFGFKKTLSYNLLTIGREWTEPLLSTTTGKEIGHKSNLVQYMDDDFTVSQISQMLPVGRTVAIEMIADGEITQDMTCKDIKAAVKKRKEADEKESTDSTTDAFEGTQGIEGDTATFNIYDTLHALSDAIEEQIQAIRIAEEQDLDKKHDKIYRAFWVLEDALQNI